MLSPHERRKLDVPERIHTKRLVLQIAKAGDGQRNYEAVVASLRRLQVWFSWANEPVTLEVNELHSRECRVNYLNRDRFLYMVLLPNQDDMIGFIGIHNRGWDPINFELSYWLRDGYEGKGYMSETVQAVLIMIFENLYAHKIIIRVEGENQRSQNVARRAGFRYEGTAHHYSPSNANHENMADMCFFSLLRCEWERQTA